MSLFSISIFEIEPLDFNNSICYKDKKGAPAKSINLCMSNAHVRVCSAWVVCVCVRLLSTKSRLTMSDGFQPFTDENDN